MQGPFAPDGVLGAGPLVDAVGVGPADVADGVAGDAVDGAGPLVEAVGVGPAVVEDGVAGDAVDGAGPLVEAVGVWTADVEDPVEHVSDVHSQRFSVSSHTRLEGHGRLSYNIPFEQLA